MDGPAKRSPPPRGAPGEFANRIRPILTLTIRVAEVPSNGPEGRPFTRLGIKVPSRRPSAEFGTGRPSCGPSITAHNALVCGQSGREILTQRHLLTSARESGLSRQPSLGGQSHG